MKTFKRLVCIAALVLFTGVAAAADKPWVVYEGGSGPGKGKHIVLLSGDEEYRSEEAMPQLGKILAERHGFKCTVLFAVNPETGAIDPAHVKNIPGLEALKSADLVIMFLRFRDLPDEQMKLIEDYLLSGKPILGLRTSTHAFNVGKGKPYERYGWTYGGNDEFNRGFGKLVFGETWISHHGSHKHESTRGLIAPGAEEHPILRGIRSGEIWGGTDVYGVTLPLPGDSRPLLLGQVLERKGPQDMTDRNFGMKPTDEPVKFDPNRKVLDKKGKELPNIDKNNPMMPIAWTKSYQLPGGKKGQAFTTTMGSATDIENEGLRRLLINAAYHLLGMDVPAKADVSLVGDYQPTAYGFNGFKKGVKPADHQK